MDRGGRIADRAVIRALGWAPGVSLEITEAGGLLVVRADPAGEFTTSGNGFLILPARVRRWCGLRPGDRVLLAADPPHHKPVTVAPTALGARADTRPTPAPEQNRPEGDEHS